MNGFIDLTYSSIRRALKTRKSEEFQTWYTLWTKVNSQNMESQINWKLEDSGTCLAVRKKLKNTLNTWPSMVLEVLFTFLYPMKNLLSNWFNWFQIMSWQGSTWRTSLIRLKNSVRSNRKCMMLYYSIRGFPSLWQSLMLLLLKERIRIRRSSISTLTLLPSSRNMEH